MRREDCDNCFNSRTPCGVRLAIRNHHPPHASFNSRTPCGVRLCWTNLHLLAIPVSIHAPRVGCDWLFSFSESSIHLFQFTHPVWGATPGTVLPLSGSVSFNSRTPCGVRPIGSSSLISCPTFQFTHPVWGATPTHRISLQRKAMFQFTHPVWGATSLLRRILRIS